MPMPTLRAGYYFLSLAEVVCVNTSARTVNWSLISRGEGDIGLNSPSVQFGARVTQMVSVGLQLKAWLVDDRHSSGLKKSGQSHS